MTEFRMPSLGADMEAGKLVEWLVKPGDHVKRGDVVAVVETQKGAIEIEVFSAGTIAALVVPVGATVPVGTVLARLDAGAAEGFAPAAAAAPAADGAGCSDHRSLRRQPLQRRSPNPRSRRFRRPRRRRPFRSPLRRPPRRPQGYPPPPVRCPRPPRRAGSPRRAASRSIA